MSLFSIHYFYMVVVEFNFNRTGFILYNGNEFKMANQIMKDLKYELKDNSLVKKFVFPDNHFTEYRRYYYKGEDYCPASRKYLNREIITNGELSIIMIESNEQIDVDHFIWYRNIPMDLGFSRN